MLLLFKIAAELAWGWSSTGGGTFIVAEIILLTKPAVIFSAFLCILGFLYKYCLSNPRNMSLLKGIVKTSATLTVDGKWQKA